MRVEIICTGDEVLTGKINNTNFSYISQKLEDHGIAVAWETTVGDDRENLLLAFQLAGQRAEAVIVNGGLGPTIDDLSQEIAARAAGVELAINNDWLARMESYFQRRGRIMSANNKKQAMLPVGAEILDNPIGTACGFAVTIGKARFFFTPGVPREMHRMLDEQVISRLTKIAGTHGEIYLKRFHSYGIGESHADSLLDGIEQLAPDGSLKLGFRAHFPQLETKLTVRGSDHNDIRQKLAPVEQGVRKRLGNFIVAEDDATLEGVIIAALESQHATLAVAETFTGGQIAVRLNRLPESEHIVLRSIVSRDLNQLCAAAGLDGNSEVTPELAQMIAQAIQRQTGATHSLVALVQVDDGADRIEFGGAVEIAIATPQKVILRRSRVAGGREWVRLGATEMALDSLRRHLRGLPVDEQIDFEKKR